MTLRFNWREPSALAAFRRGDRLWLLFDKPARIDLGGMQVAGEGVIEDAQQFPHGQAAWVRLGVQPSMTADLKRDGDAWVVDLLAGRNIGEAKQQADASVDIVRRNGVAQDVRVAIPKGSKLFHLYDPDVGDELFVAPVRDPANAMPRLRRFVQFDLLPTSAGVVVAKKSDGLAVRALEDAVEITAPTLLVSSAEESSPKHAGRKVAGLRRPLSHIKEWQFGSGPEIGAVQKRLINRILNAPAPKRNGARLDLARFYLSHQMPGAASGVLEIVRRQDQSYERSLDFRAMRGAAALLMGHFADAAADLNFSFLEKDPSVAPWLGALSAAKGDWKAAHRHFSNIAPIVADYPAWLANRFWLQATEAALAVGDMDVAGSRVATLGRIGLSPSQQPQRDYLRAFLLKKEGKSRGAVEIWNGLADSGDRKVRAKAAFAATETLLEDGDIDTTAAIDRLERLTFAWRGDAFEFDLLRRLADLHTGRNNYRDALNRYRQAASYFEDVQGADAMTQKMREMFNRLYLEGGADKLPAVRALALYEEFRELTPAGKMGDEMIRRLADRLADADLLPEAAQLLAHQVEFRLEGAKKAEVGARLALLQLLDLKPGAAIKSLDVSRVDRLPADLAQRRRHLRAQALGRLGRAKEALAVIDGDASRDAEMIRLSVHWRARAWRDAGRAIGRILAGVTPAALGQNDPRLILQWAVALALDNDKPGLAALRHRFGKVMAASPQAEAFDAIAGKDTERAPDYKTLARKAGELDTFEAFMAAYRDQVKASRDAVIN